MSDVVKTISTIIIADNGLYRDGLAHILSAERYEIVASAPAVDADVLSLLNPEESTLLVLIGDAGPKDTVEQLKLYKDQQKNGCCVVIFEHEAMDEFVEALQAGANACLNKGTTSDVLLKAIELVMHGETVVPHELVLHLLRHEDSWAAEMMADNERPAPDLDVVSAPPPPFVAETVGALPRLSTQERRIITCLINGDSNKVIARKVDIAEATVKVHIKAIFRKLGLKNRTQAAVWGLNRGSKILGSASDSSTSDQLYQRLFRLTGEGLPSREFSDP